jgi:5-methylcytosine-specific restriction protein A
VFTQGQIYKRSAIQDRFGGQRQGGISTPARSPIILVFTSSQGEQYGYSDGWNSGIFYYTGEGQVGDMEFKGGNKAIRDHADDGKDIHLFRYTRKAFVEYVGQFVCTGSHDRRAPDVHGNDRRAVVFELVPLNEFQEIGSPDRQPEVTDLENLRARALAGSAQIREAVARLQAVRERSAAVREYVLARAAGVCEGCRMAAPFVTAQGIPYLEPHHTRRLSDGGPDHPAWVIALCPNCHRSAHYGADGPEYNRTLTNRANDLERRPHIP